MLFEKKLRYSSRSLASVLHPMLNCLPITEKAIQKIQVANDTHLLRFYFGTADQTDVDAIYTHLLISWGLAGRMKEAEGIRNELWKGIELVNAGLSRQSKEKGKEDPLVLVALQDIVRSSLALWRSTTVDELEHTIDELNGELQNFRNKRQKRRHKR